MGCDIHGWIEIEDGDKYIAIRELPNRQRNYQRFAALAGVRNYRDEFKVTPKGIPENISETANYHIKQWDTDGHSHSYMPICEAAKIFLETEHQPRDFAKEYPESEFFDVDSDCEDVDKIRLVFWFDN